jgi:hypothetical protein
MLLRASNKEKSGQLQVMIMSTAQTSLARHVHRGLMQLEARQECCRPTHTAAVTHTLCTIHEMISDTCMIAPSRRHRRLLGLSCPTSLTKGQATA